MHQAFFKTFRLRNAAQSSDFAPFDILHSKAFPGKDVLEIKRVMDTFDDPRNRIMLADAGPQPGCFSIALGDKDGASAGQMRWRFAQSPARQQMFVTKGLLAINQNNVPAPARQLPILEAVVEQQRVAAEFFDSVAAALYPVF